MSDNLENTTSEIKALALDVLDIKVYARGTDNVEIKGVIPPKLALTTITRTLGCVSDEVYMRNPLVLPRARLPSTKTKLRPFFQLLSVSWCHFLDRFLKPFRRSSTIPGSSHRILTQTPYHIPGEKSPDIVLSILPAGRRRLFQPLPNNRWWPVRHNVSRSDHLERGY